MHNIGQEEIDAVRRVIESKKLLRYQGEERSETDRFEDEWAEKTGAKYAIAMNSGASALAAALVGMGVGPGDEVIVPGHTFIATAAAALVVGAVPIIAEVDASLTIDPADVERKITSRTKVIAPVHIIGFPADMDMIKGVANRHGLMVLEDSAQAVGGSYKGRRLGSIGDAGIFSFNYYKIISCGEGGALVTDDPMIYQQAAIYHDMAAGLRHNVGGTPPVFAGGTKFRFNEILSAVLRVQLRRLDGILESLRAEKHALMAELAGLSCFQFTPSHDPEGGCATELGLLFDAPGRAEAFVAHVKEAGFGVGRAIDTGCRVYTNWEPVMERRGSHHPDRDPYRTWATDVEYSKDMCPNTLDYLGRTVLISIQAERPDDEFRNLAKALKDAALA